ncbi:MAG: hypothetical protein ACOX08_10340 [Methanobacterium sp.]|jgi:hypothetical protein
MVFKNLKLMVFMIIPNQLKNKREFEQKFQTILTNGADDPRKTNSKPS